MTTSKIKEAALFPIVGKEETVELLKYVTRGKPETQMFIKCAGKLKVGESIYVSKDAWKQKTIPREYAARFYTEWKFQTINHPEGNGWYIVRKK